MDARTIVEQAVTALIRGDLDGHLVHISDEVALKLGNNAEELVTRNGYRTSVETFLLGIERVRSFDIQDVRELGGGFALVTVRQEHVVRVLDRQPAGNDRQRSEVLKYRVEGDKIRGLDWTTSGKSRLVIHP